MSARPDNSGDGAGLEILSGGRTLPARLKFLRHVANCRLQRKKYPLAYLRASRGGLLSTIRLRRKLNRKKVVRFNGRYLFSLNFPLFPSKAFDHMVSRGGLNITASGTPFKKQIDFAILAITQKCHLACEHCYERYNLADEDSISVEEWKAVVRELQQAGTSIITFSGGEPMLRFEGLLELLKAGNKDLSDFHLHTSGCGVTGEKARALRAAGLTAAGVGLDDPDPARHDGLRGRAGAHDEAVQALRHFHEAGVFPYVNACLTKDLVRSGRLADFLRFARDRNVGAIRWLEPRPCGGYFSKRPEELFSEDDRRVATAFYQEANTKRTWRDSPPIAYPGYEESPECLGCQMGGLVHFYIDSRGNVEPCVFLPVSFGNIRDVGLPAIMARMRKAVPYPLRRGCPGNLLVDQLKAAHGRSGIYPVRHEDVSEAWKAMWDTTSEKGD